MLFLTSLSNYNSPVYKAMLSHQELFGRLFCEPSNMQDIGLWNKWGLDNGAISSLNIKINQLAGKRVRTFSDEYMRYAFQVIQNPHGDWFNMDAFFKALDKVAIHKQACLFVVVPDVPFDWQQTLAVYQQWQSSIQRLGYPRALAVQNGATVENIPWQDVDAIFIGGDTAWKRSHWQQQSGDFKPYSLSQEQDAVNIAKAAKQCGKHVHFGRQANSIKQLIDAYQWSADSVDGTGETKAPDKEFKWISKTMWQLNNQDQLRNRWLK